MLSALIFALVQSPLPTEPGRTEQTILSNGVRRTYLLRIPKGYDNRKSRPVVFGFHGWTSNAKQFEAYTRLADAAEERGMISVIPQGLGRTPGWNVGWINLTGVTPAPDDTKLFGDILDSLESGLKIDKKRVYVTGHSNGAFLTHLIAATSPGRVAAFGAVAGTIGLPGKDVKMMIPAPLARTSGLVIHGDKDETVAYDRNAKVLLKGYGARESAEWWATKLGYAPAGEDQWKGRDGEVRLVTIKGGGHGWPSTATGTLLDFFEKHPKK